MTILHPEGGAISAAVEHILLYDEPLGWKEPRGSAFGGRRTTCGFSSCTIFPGSFTGAIVPFACMALSYMGILVITGGDVYEEKEGGFSCTARNLRASRRDAARIHRIHAQPRFLKIFVFPLTLSPLQVLHWFYQASEGHPDDPKALKCAAEMLPRR